MCSQIVVQQRSGNLVWEAGSDNRVVSVPEGAPVDSMITSVCAFNIIDTTAESKLQPVTADVLALLDAQLEEQAAAKEAQLAAQAERAAEEAEKARVVQAAAAVANAFATMGKLVCLLLSVCCRCTVVLLIAVGQCLCQCPCLCGHDPCLSSTVHATNKLMPGWSQPLSSAGPLSLTSPLSCC